VKLSLIYKAAFFVISQKLFKISKNGLYKSFTTKLALFIHVNNIKKNNYFQQ